MKSIFIDTREVISHLIPLYVKGKTLDIGGGTSKYRELINKSESVKEYIVSDLYNSPGVDVVTDIRQMSFESESFDSVLSFQVLEHVDDTMAAVSEIYRVLRKGGYIIITAPFLGAQHGDPSDFYRFTPEGMCWYLEKAGFVIIESGKQGGTFSVVSELLRFAFLNPYRKHSRLRAYVFARVFNLLKYFDRKGLLQNSNLFTNVYVVGQKV